MYYSEEQFLDQVTRSPLFKSFRTKPNQRTLKRLKFAVENYTPQGLLILKDLLQASEKQGRQLQQKGELSKKISDAYLAYFEKIRPCLRLIASGNRDGLSLITILWLSPEFEKRITDIRLKHNIDQVGLKKEIYALFPKTKGFLVSNNIEEKDATNYHALIGHNPTTERIDEVIREVSEVSRIIYEFILKKFPKLDQDIADLRNRYGLVPAYDNYLRDFILYSRISEGDILPVKRKRNYKEKADIDLRYDNTKTLVDLLDSKGIYKGPFRPHIAIIIYGSTPIESVYDMVKLVYGVHPDLGKNNESFVSKLPSYRFKKTIPDMSYETIRHKAMLYFFRDVCGLREGEIVELYEYLGESITKGCISRDIKAFKKVFQIDQKTST